MSGADPIIDRFAEALRVNDNGMIRPLWADAPEHLKEFWRVKAKELLRVMERRGITVSLSPGPGSAAVAPALDLNRLNDSAGPPPPAEVDPRATARMKGYVGDPCPDCGNLTMVRNGTCLRCDSCGATTGCS